MVACLVDRIQLTGQPGGSPLRDQRSVGLGTPLPIAKTGFRRVEGEPRGQLRLISTEDADGERRSLGQRRVRGGGPVEAYQHQRRVQRNRGERIHGQTPRDTVPSPGGDQGHPRRKDPHDLPERQILAHRTPYDDTAATRVPADHRVPFWTILKAPLRRRGFATPQGGASFAGPGPLRVRAETPLTTGPMRRHWLLFAVILTAPYGCDNVTWGGVDVRLQDPPPKAEAMETVASETEEGSPLPELPTGAILFAGSREGDSATLVAVGEIRTTAWPPSRRKPRHLDSFSTSPRPCWHREPSSCCSPKERALDASR